MASAKICSLVGQYDNPIPTRFLAPIGCYKIPALGSFSKEKDKTRVPRSRSEEETREQDTMS